VYDGKGALPAVCYKLTEGQDHGFTLYDLSERVRLRGWLIASYPLPASREATVIQRILIRHGVSRDLAQLLLDDLARALEHLRENPVPRTSAGPTFHH
jgi:glutamate decarboxylase